MLSFKLEHDLEWMLEHEVDDLAKYNILRYLHDHPEAQGGASFFANELGLRPPERAAECLEALAEDGLLTKVECDGEAESCFRLSNSPRVRDLVDRLYRLSSTSFYGEIMQRLAGRSLHKVRKARAVSRANRSNGYGPG